MDFHECDIKTKDNAGNIEKLNFITVLKGFVYQRGTIKGRKDNPQNRKTYALFFVSIIIIIKDYIPNGIYLRNIRLHLKKNQFNIFVKKDQKPHDSPPQI